LIKKLLKRQKILKSYSERFLFFKRMNFDQNFFLFYCCKNVTVPFHCDCALVVQKMFGKTSLGKKSFFFFSTFYLGAVLYYCWDVFHFISFSPSNNFPHPLKFFLLVFYFINAACRNLA